MSGDQSTIINGVTYNQSAFDIYNYDNLYGYYGPVLFPIDLKSELRPMGMSIHSDNEWYGLDGSETLNFSIIAPAAGVKYYLMFR